MERITGEIIGAGIAVHRELGPGLLESAYQNCLFHELTQRGLDVERQKQLPLVYKGLELDCGYRIDLIVERRVIVEVKSVDALNQIHSAQLLTYLKLSGCEIGLLMNFNVDVLKNGLRRHVLNYTPRP